MEPILIGRRAGWRPRGIRGSTRVAQHLRERRPDRVHDGVHALDLAVTRQFRRGAGGPGRGRRCGRRSHADDGRCAPGCALGDRRGAGCQSGELRVLHGAAQLDRCSPSPIAPSCPNPRRWSWPTSRSRPRETAPAWSATSPRVAFLSYSTRAARSGPRWRGAPGGGAASGSSRPRFPPTARCRRTRR